MLVHPVNFVNVSASPSAPVSAPAFASPVPSTVYSFISSANFVVPSAAIPVSSPPSCIGLTQ